MHNGVVEWDWGLDLGLWFGIWLGERCMLRVEAGLGWAGLVRLALR